MRPLLPFLLFLALAGCSHALATRIDARTFSIRGPGVAGGSTAANKHLAQELCPGGYRLLSSTERYNTPDGYRYEPGTVYDIWVVRCI